MITEKIINDMVQYYNNNFFKRGILLPYPLEAFIAQQINQREQIIADANEAIKQLNRVQNKCNHWQTKVVDEKVVCEDCGKVLK
jgi:hypothetical protein